MPAKFLIFRSIWIFIATNAIFLPNCNAETQDLSVPSPNLVQEQTARVVQEYMEDRKRGVDMRLVDQLVNNMMIFTGNFCNPPESRECTDNFWDSANFSMILSDYLDDLTARLPSETQSIADRLAEGNLNVAGWLIQPPFHRTPKRFRFWP